MTAKRLLKLLEGKWGLYIGGLLATCLATLCSLVSPVIIKITIDSVISGNPLDAPQPIIQWIESIGGVSVLTRNIWICGLAMVAITVIQGAFDFARGAMIANASESIAKNMKDNLYDHLQKLPYDYHVKAQTGDLIQRCTSDVDTVRRFLAGQVVELGRTALVIILAVSIMFSLSVSLTLVSLIMIPLIFISAMIFFKRIRAVFLKVDEKEGELSAVLQESLSGIRVVRAFGRQQFETEKFEERNSGFRVLCIGMIKQMAYFWSLSDVLCISQMAITLIYGVYQAYLGVISLGTLILFTSYVGMFIWPIRGMARMLTDMGKMQVSLGRIYEVLNEPEEADTPGAISPSLKGDITFSRVNFEYDQDKPVIRDMSFTVNSGETIAILGTTGSGKSTFLHLLLRLYDYKSGSIKINNVELSNINKKWLREKIGIVLQEPFLYSKTIRDNIKMAKNNVADHEIYEATRTASVHDVIEEFENGYETMVGERGVTLSGGQKQRVAIARTLIKNSDILIFDDSLSAVDTETDSQIRAALKERSKDVTTFIISQRITTLMQADRIFVVEGGQLTDIGTHDDLVKKDGLYARIWKIQNMLEEDFEDEVSS